MNDTISERVRTLHNRLVGTKIRHQTVESVEIGIDSNGPDWTLRYFIFVLPESDFELVLDGAMEESENEIQIHQFREDLGQRQNINMGLLQQLIGRLPGNCSLVWSVAAILLLAVSRLCVFARLPRRHPGFH